MVIRHTWVLAGGRKVALKLRPNRLRIDMVTNDSLQELLIAVSNGTIAGPLYNVPFRHNTARLA